MPTYSKTTLHGLINGQIVTNSEGLITAEVLNNILNNVVDSYGDLIPAHTTDSRLALEGPATGQLIYNTTLNRYEYYNGTAWVVLSAAVTPYSLSSNPLFPESIPGDVYLISAAGKIGGSSGVNLMAGDLVICHTVSEEGDYATVADNFTMVHTQPLTTGVDNESLVSSAATFSGEKGIALGKNANNTAKHSVALGYGAVARVDRAIVISGAPMVRKSDGTADADPVKYLSASEAILTTPEIDATDTQVVTLTVPTGANFFLTELGIIATDVDTITANPEIQFGKTGDTDYIQASAERYFAAAGSRVRITDFTTAEGFTTLSAEVTVAATATACKLRFYYKGFLVEDQ
jgi:hypothetical protein